MAEDKILNKILSKIEHLDSKVESLDSKVEGLDSKVESLDLKVESLDLKVDKFKNETNETLARIEKRTNATFDQVGGLSEYRNVTKNQLDNIESDMSYYALKQVENEKKLYKIEQKITK